MTTPRMTRGLSGAALAALMAGLFVAEREPLSAQAGPPQATFRSDVSYVEVDVVVTDAQGQFVPGLSAKDFELVDAGKPQTVEVFREINVAVEHADKPLFSPLAIPSDVASNEQAAEGRVYVLLLDDLHTTPVNTLHVRKRAREFVERYLGSNDLAAVVHSSGRRDVAQEFTSDRSLLLAAIDGFNGRGLPSNIKNRMDDFQLRRGTPAFGLGSLDYDARERLGVARGAFTAVRNVAGYLASLSGRRKALLLFSEGMDLDLETALTLDAQSATLGHIQDVRSELIEAISVATRANVHVYTIDAAGMNTGVVAAETGTIPFGEFAVAQGLTTEAITNERRRIQGTLRTIADETGGIAIVNTGNFADGFSRIQRENSTYYLLGFYPSTERDGKFHELKVRTNVPGLQVRARAGYHAPKGSTRPRAAADPFVEMLRAAVPTAGLPMRLSAPVFKGTVTHATAVMTIDVAKEVFRFEAGAAGWSEDLDLVYQLIDPNANVVASESQNVQLRLQPEARDLVEERGFRIIIPITVRPGRYQVRIAARTANSAMRGSLFADLIVPDFFTPPLLWSGVSLTSAGALRVPTRPPDTAVPPHIPVVPAAQRVFASDDTLVLYAEAYDNNTGTPHIVDLTTLVRDTTGKIVLSTIDERASSDRRVYGVRAEIPLNQLPPGQYVLTLTARSRAAGHATATRDITFTIL